uniref:50S ribosomal protein L29 n=1 Tax=Choreocolax polysiphoniae TaxID=282351 RepID=A0A0B5VQH5_9FLOR|nr:50S ribosomal protein L29 [Choreocolax polysiphoniae]AJH65862.1 50S ribosomal protein L29 [Choreocolax polysiphoniae]
MILKNNQLLIDISNSKAEITKLKKQLFFLKIKKITKQNINRHKIKQIQHKISQILQLNKLNIIKYYVNKRKIWNSL